MAQLEVRLKNLNDKKLAGRTEALDAGHHRGGKDEEEEEEEEMAAIDMEASIEVLKKSIGGLPEDIKAMLLANIKRRLTPQPIKIRADVDVSCYSYQGIDAVKNALREAKKFGSEEFPMTISLIAPPQYTIQTTSLEKKEGIARCNQAVEAVKKSILAAGGRLAVKMEAKATTSRDEEELARHLEAMAMGTYHVENDISTTTKEEKAEEDPVTQGYFLKKTISKFNDLPIDAKLAQGIVAVGYETPSGKFLFIYIFVFFCTSIMKY